VSATKFEKVSKDIFLLTMNDYYFMHIAHFILYFIMSFFIFTIIKVFVIFLMLHVIFYVVCYFYNKKSNNSTFVARFFVTIETIIVLLSLVIFTTYILSLVIFCNNIDDNNVFCRSLHDW
jgi:hypothetical protein